MLDWTTKNSMSLIDREKNECWKLQRLKWAKSQIVIIFYLDNWQATDLLKEIIRIFITLLFLLKFSRVFEIISCPSADLWFIIRFTLHNLTAVTQLRNILIHFIWTIIFQNIFYTLTVTKERSHIIKDVIATSCNFTFSSLSVKAKCISFLEMRKKIMQRMLCSTKSTKTSKSIEIINFYDDEYEFVLRWRIMFSFLIDNEYFSIFDLDYNFVWFI